MIDTVELRRKAEKATQGPWKLLDGQIIQTNHITRDVWTIPKHTDDMEFIAAANPATVIALLDRLEAAEKVCGAFEWTNVNDKLPERPKYDWVLVATMLVPEGWYGVPHIAELRDGVWFCSDCEMPMEKELGVKVTHWMELPKNPIFGRMEG